MAILSYRLTLQQFLLSPRQNNKSTHHYHTHLVLQNIVVEVIQQNKTESTDRMKMIYLFIKYGCEGLLLLIVGVGGILGNVASIAVLQSR